MSLPIRSRSTQRFVNFSTNTLYNPVPVNWVLVDYILNNDESPANAGMMEYWSNGVLGFFAGIAGLLIGVVGIIIK